MFKVVPDWKDFWRWYSVWLSALVAAIPVVWVQLPPDIKAFIPAGAEPYIMGGMFVVMVLGRIKDQP